MKTITLGDIRHLKAEELEAVTPATVSVNGKESLLLARLTDAVVLVDLHPRVQNRIKNLIARARMGMPKPEKVKLEEVHTRDEVPVAA
jgi:hypothetical protein